jgi:predicted phage terminase large subunit-like protein
MRRRAIRRSLTEWVRVCGFDPAKHHQLLIAELEKVASGETRRLAFFLPPGSAKSTYGSVLFPPWFMANANANVLAASHTIELAEKWGRRVRNLVSEHSLELGISPAPDNQAAGRWALTTGAEYYAAGVGTGIAGFRAKLGLIDDPIRSRQDADSELIRDRIWDWYINDFRTRLVPGAAEILIQTRWHEDDLAGRALQHNEWRVVSLPAIAEANDQLGRKPGEPLWSDGSYGYGEQIQEIRKTTPPRTWSALYQQRPAPEDGDYFKAEWLRPYTAKPAVETMRIYGASDYAVTADGGDYTVHGVIGLDPSGQPWLLDVWRGQTDSATWIDAWCDMVLEWKPMEWGEEGGQIRAAVGPFIDRRARERGVFVYRRQIPSKHDKAVRAQSIRGLMAMRGLMVPINAPWYEALRSELLAFPAGKHDDQVDVLSLIGQLLDTAFNGRVEDDDDEDGRDYGRSRVTGY